MLIKYSVHCNNVLCVLSVVYAAHTLLCLLKVVQSLFKRGLRGRGKKSRGDLTNVPRHSGHTVAPVGEKGGVH